MDPDKLRIFKSGMSDEQREKVLATEAVEAEFKREKEMVNGAMRHKGFRLILSKMVSDLEGFRYKLLDCKAKHLVKLQTEVKVRKEFLDKWTPYAD